MPQIYIYIMEHLFDSNEGIYQNHKDTRLSVGNNSIEGLTGLWVQYIYGIDK